METLVTALGPVIVVAFAIQHLFELVEQFVFADSGAKNKKRILRAVSLGLGLVLAFGFGLRVMQPIGVGAAAFGFGLRVTGSFAVEAADWVDGIITAILLSAVTEGSNSIMKILEYYKDKLKDGNTSSEENDDGGGGG